MNDTTRNILIGALIFLAGISVAWWFSADGDTESNSRREHADKTIEQLLPQINEGNKELNRLTGKKVSWPRDSSSVKDHERMLGWIQRGIERAQDQVPPFAAIEKQHKLLVDTALEDHRVSEREKDKINKSNRALKAARAKARKKANEAIEEADRIFFDFVDKYYPEDEVDTSYLSQRRRSREWTRAMKKAVIVYMDPSVSMEWGPNWDDELSGEFEFVRTWHKNQGNTDDLQQYATAIGEAEWSVLGLPESLDSEQEITSYQAEFRRKYVAALLCCSVFTFEKSEQLWREVIKNEFLISDAGTWYNFVDDYSRAKLLGTEIPRTFYESRYKRLQSRFTDVGLLGFSMRWRELVEEYYQRKKDE